MITLPQEHRIIEYFQFMNNSIDKSINFFKYEVYQIINDLNNVFNEFNIQIAIPINTYQHSSHGNC